MPLIMFVSSSFNTYVNLAKKKKGDADSIQIGTLFSYWVISGAVDLGFQLNLYGWKDKK